MDFLVLNGVLNEVRYIGVDLCGSNTWFRFFLLTTSAFKDLDAIYRMA